MPVIQLPGKHLQINVFSNKDYMHGDFVFFPLETQHFSQNIKGSGKCFQLMVGRSHLVHELLWRALRKVTKNNKYLVNKFKVLCWGLQPYCKFLRSVTVAKSWKDSGLRDHSAPNTNILTGVKDEILTAKLSTAFGHLNLQKDISGIFRSPSPVRGLMSSLFQLPI